jgi:hypothetical protein
MSYAKFKVLIGKDPARITHVHNPNHAFRGANQEDIANTIMNTIDPTMVSGSILTATQNDDDFGAEGLWAFKYDYTDGRATQYVIIREVNAVAGLPLDRDPVLPAIMGEPTDSWVERPGHLIADWRYEVSNGDTMRGYADWCAARDEMEGR